MAVPKKRTSKSKKNLRKTVWKKKVLSQLNQAQVRKVKSLTKVLLPLSRVDIESSGLGFGPMIQTTRVVKVRKSKFQREREDILSENSSNQ